MRKGRRPSNLLRLGPAKEVELSSGMPEPSAKLGGNMKARNKTAKGLITMAIARRFSRLFGR